MTAPARLWFGQTAHVREKPFRRAFKHRIAMLEIAVSYTHLDVYKRQRVGSAISRRQLLVPRSSAA